MGACLSVVDMAGPHYSTTEGMQALYRSFGFTPHDTNQLYDIFVRADADLDNTEYTKKTFKIMDVDDSGEVDFEEFVLAMWKFCLFNKEALIRFSFGLYDEDGSGEIDTMEAQRFIKDVWGDEWHHNQHAETINEKLSLLARMHDGCITMDQFVKFMHSHPILLFPAFQIQREMVSRVLGESYWGRIETQLAANKPTRLTDEEIMNKFNEYHNQTKYDGIEHNPMAPLPTITDDDTTQVVNDYKFQDSFRSKQASKGPAKKYAKPTTIAVAPRKPSIKDVLRRKSQKFVERFPVTGKKSPTKNNQTED
ncbi:hypothetical protein ACHHYP_12604 [Achlya hypogyna]|uniref:EF-hand domain-containing protein n=1 Tax=Achlya hypogyna TaxID=1202772 RepID=A0A1V9YGT3_ACHHY|nr:hypothetical protein ACHHYP_12604 [Achlya hypogyna]